MKKKEYYLDYNRKSKKRKFYSSKEGLSRKTIAFFILLFATVIGTGVTLLLLYQEDQEKKGRDNVENKIINKPLEELMQTSLYGPYGMWISKPVEEEILEPENTKESWMADFVDTRTAVPVKGIYVTASKANSSIDDLIQLVDDTELNTMVIDIKDDDGHITYMMETETTLAINAPRNYIEDLSGLIKRLKEKDVYLIARVVAFKDPVLAEAKP
jgi:hypothetical protein